MSLTKDINIPEQEWEEIIVPPTDLWSDEPPLESDLHRQQMDLLFFVPRLNLGTKNRGSAQECKI